MAAIAYCGTPPSPGELLGRFNLDPVLLCGVVILAVLHLYQVRGTRARWGAAVGWAFAATALISPLCALSVSLFSARIAQHMLLLLVAAPLIASALPVSRGTPTHRHLWLWTGLFCAALWYWHMPIPYDATFRSTLLYWSMHVSLFGSGVMLWRELVHHRTEDTVLALSAGMVTSMQMSLLGALLALASHPLFRAHLLTAPLWQLTPLQDQQLGGTIMWVPGIALFLWAALRSMRRLWVALDSAKVT